MDDNIFAILSKYKKKEDYLTASLLCILRNMWINADMNERATCAELLFNLSGIKFDMNEKVDFITQWSYKGVEKKDKSRLDAQISSGDKCIWIEVKDQARLGKGQIERYLSHLSELNYPEENKKLVLLRNYYGDWQEANKAHIRIYWFEVYDWLDSIMCHANLRENTINWYLVKEFLIFLKSKGVRIMNKIDKIDLHNSLNRIEDFITMLKQVVEQSEFTVKTQYYDGGRLALIFDLNLKENRSRRDFIGYGLERGKYDVGIDTGDISYLWMGMCRKDVKINDAKLKEKSKHLDWEIEEDKNNKEYDWIWVRSPINEFFNSQDKKAQIEQLRVIFTNMFEQLKEVQVPRRGRR